jgi:copper chaperone CopZ
METVTLLVPGMNCRQCVRKVTAAMRDVAGVALVQADARTTTVVLHGHAAVVEVLAALRGAGFPGTVVPPPAEDSEIVRDESAP